MHSLSLRGREMPLLTCVVSLVSASAHAQAPAVSHEEGRQSAALFGPALTTPIVLPGVLGALELQPLLTVSRSELDQINQLWNNLVQADPRLAALPIPFQLAYQPANHAPALAPTMILGGRAEPGSGIGIDACDERVLASTSSFPFNTISYLNLRFTGGGWSRCSGACVSRYMLLTAGHCVWDRDTDAYFDEFLVKPGRDGSTLPYGEWSTTIAATNSTYTTTSDSNRHNYDYGAVFTSTQLPFTTTMPVQFDYSATLGNTLNMSGYPATNPSGNSTTQQWRGSGSIWWSSSRKVYYNIKSVGGASGSPVWRYTSSNGARNIVAVNVSHSTDCDGIGSRMVSNNRTLIESWMAWDPTDAGVNSALPPIGESLLTAEELNLCTVPALASTYLAPTRGMAQVIDNTFYSWDEYDVPDDTGHLLRAVKLLQPYEAWLSVADACVLLSASRNLEVVYPELNPSVDALTGDQPAPDHAGRKFEITPAPAVDVGFGQ